MDRLKSIRVSPKAHDFLKKKSKSDRRSIVAVVDLMIERENKKEK